MWMTTLTSSRMDRCGPQHSSSSVQSTCSMHTHTASSLTPTSCLLCVRVLLSSLVSQEMLDEYKGDTVGHGIPHGEGELTTARGAKITGPFHDGAAHGVVKVIEKNGDVYEGCMVGGVRETRDGTKAVLSMRNGDIYEGGFEDGEYSGRGTYACMKEGTVFDGHFTNGLRHGRGRLSTRFGNVFDGVGSLTSASGLALRIRPLASGKKRGT